MKALTAFCMLAVTVTLAIGCESEPRSEESVRFGQFNIWELSRAKLDQMDAAGRGTSPQLQKAAEIIQRVRPDGVEDHRGRRNFDEIRLWADYIAGGERASYIVDDAGRTGGLAAEALFVVMGDMNNNPQRDPGPYGMAAMSQILNLERVQDPISDGVHRSVDYVLPSVGFDVVGQGVFWPADGDSQRVLVDEPEPASDHRMIWVDVRIP